MKEEIRENGKEKEGEEASLNNCTNKAIIMITLIMIVTIITDIIIITTINQLLSLQS
jgi:hypothetical protein